MFKSMSGHKAPSSAKENGLKVETNSISGFDMEEVYVSTTEGEMGEGAEIWYKFDTDSIEVTAFQDEGKNDDEYYSRFKRYVVRNKYMTL